MGSILMPGYLYWDGFKYVTQVVSSTLTGPAGGDLSGTYPNPSVVKLNGNPVSAAVPTTGQFLEWNGTTWGPTTIGNFFTAGGDLSGSSTSQTVIAIRGNPVMAQTLGAGQSNYALVWNGSIWAAENVFLNQSAGGDLGDFYPNPTTRALWHAAIPEVLPSNPGATTGFAIGNVLQVTNVTANVQALGYGPLSLGTGVSSPNVSGILGASFQAPQFLTGDLSGNTNSNGGSYNFNFYGATVTKIQNIPVEHVSLGLSQDGYVLTYVNASGQWVPLASTTGASLAGDISGAITNTHVAELQGHTLTAGSPGGGQALVYNGSAWVPTTLTLTISGDVVGSTNISGNANTTVVKIQDNPVKSGILGIVQDGYVLTWNNTDGMWEAIINAGGQGAFVAGGDLSGVSTDQTVIKINHTSVNASPSTNTVLVATSSTTSSWQTIADANVSSGANIAGSKINTTTGGIVSVVASNTIQASAIVATTEYFVGSSGPTITAGTGVPVTTPAGGDGSIFLRKDGTTDGTESIYSYEGSAWVPVGAASAGAAGGDLSGFYPNPTVIAIQKNAIANTLLGATQDGYVLTWVNANNEWKAEPSSSSTVAGGDLSGFYPNPTVIAINSTSVPASPSANQVLVATSSSAATWELISNSQISGSAAISYSKLNLTGNIVNSDINSAAAISVSKLAAGASAQFLINSSAPTPIWVNMSGDVTLSNTGASIVGKIQGVTISGTPSTGQVLTATSSTAADWQTFSGTITLSGDVTGASNSNTVTKIQNNTVTSGALTKGNFLIATSTSNWAETAITGDVSVGVVTPGLTTVIALQTNPVEFQALTSADDGYVLTWYNAGPYWYAAPGASGSFSAGGDLSGSSTNQTVHSIQGVVISGTPSTGYVLEATSPTAASWQPAASGSFAAGGDLSGTSTVQNVIKLQGNAVQSGTLGPSEDGYVLTWTNASNEWKAEPASGSGGGETGKVVYTSKTVTSNYTIDTSENDYYIWCNQTAPINITLPVPSAGRTINIKDISNNANTNNITIVRSGSEEIEGVAASYVLSVNLDSVTLGSDGTNWWIV